MPKKKIANSDWTREIFIVHQEKDGTEKKQDFDLLSMKEQQQFREQVSRTARNAMGYFEKKSK